MAVDITPYIAEIQRLMGIVLARAKSSGVANGILGVDQADILLAGALNAAIILEKNIYKEIISKEGRSYDSDSNMALDKALHKHSYSSEKNYYEYDQRYSLIWIYSTYSEFPCLIVYRSEICTEY